MNLGTLAPSRAPQQPTTADCDTEAAPELLAGELGATPLDDTTWQPLAAGYDH